MPLVESPGPARLARPDSVYDVLVVGAGAVGASTALHLARQGHRVVVIEKEPGPARHQSGRNSGVIHAGYNLKPGSQKARFCVEGSRRLRAYCAERGVPVVQQGILVVARNEPETETLQELRRRSQGNGVQAALLDARELREVEPFAEGVAALHAPEGASFDAVGYVTALVRDGEAAGVRFVWDVRVRSLREAGEAGCIVETDRGAWRARVVVNCAGLHADRLAGDLARDLRVVPFRGYYAELRTPRRALVRSHIYGAPDLHFPFLGVHFSRRFDDRVIVGPGAMLALGREAYHLPVVNARDAWDTFTWPGFYRLLARPEFRRLVRSEVDKSLRLRAIWKEARALVPSLRRGDLVRSYAGNRAQLVDREGRLVEDLTVRETDHAVHVLNVVSPGLTASLPFGEHVASRASFKL